MRLWGGRFSEANDARVADFTRSIDLDRALALDDLDGSVAHVNGLARAGLVTAEETNAIVAGLGDLRREVEAGTIEWDPALEDVHLNLEAALAERIGPVAGKLHTGRSRNDQVATDLRLWLRRTIDRVDAAVARTSSAPSSGSPSATATPSCPARPISSRPSRSCLAHHLLAYVEMLERDRGRLGGRRGGRTSRRSGPVRWPGPATRSTARRPPRELGFDGVTANSLDAVSDRDFVVEFVAAAALAMVHLSRLAEEITWWSNPRFGFVRVSDAFSTGSSMMPNKKNPDPAELVRGRAARGHRLADRVCSPLLKGLPLAYQRDLQEDKAPLFETAATLEASLGVMAGLIETLHDRPRPDADRGGRGLHDGHRRGRRARPATASRSGRAPRRRPRLSPGRAAGVGLDAVTDAMVGLALGSAGDETPSGAAADPPSGDALRAAASIDGALASCDVIGGTAPGAWRRPWPRLERSSTGGSGEPGLSRRRLRSRSSSRSSRRGRGAGRAPRPGEDHVERCVGPPVRQLDRGQDTSPGCRPGTGSPVTPRRTARADESPDPQVISSCCPPETVALTVLRSSSRTSWRSITPFVSIVSGPSIGAPTQIGIGLISTVARASPIDESAAS